MQSTSQREGDWFGERTRLACGFRRPAGIVPTRQTKERSLERDAQGGTLAECAPLGQATVIVA
jgi:hypothetical protein